jgi:hypothetical protein
MAILACKPAPPEEDIYLGFRHFPTEVGAKWIYDVDSLAYDDNTGSTTIDTFKYEYKEEIIGTFLDVSGKTAQIISRAYRQMDTDQWIPANNATLLITDLNVQKVQENIRYVKFVFPLQLNNSWNGNLYNTLLEEQYRITKTNETFHIGLSNYWESFTILQVDELNAIEEIKREEVYAIDVGLVSLISDSINTQVSGSRGYRYRLKLKEFDRFR